MQLKVLLNSCLFNSCRFIFAINLWNLQVAKESQTVKLIGVRLEFCQKCEKKNKKNFVFALSCEVKRAYACTSGGTPAHDLHCFLFRHRQDEREADCDLFFSFPFLFDFPFLIFAMQMIIKKHWSASLCCDTSIYHQRAAFHLWLNSTNHSPPRLKLVNYFISCKAN